MSWHYQYASSEHLGYWRAVDPAITDIDDILRDSGQQDNYRILIHGTPCVPSPEWNERHPGEAAEGVATYPYNVGRESIEYSAHLAQVFQDSAEGRDDVAYTPQDYDAMAEYIEILSENHTWATNFCNILILATQEDCWAEVEWIDFVDL